MAEQIRVVVHPSSIESAEWHGEDVIEFVERTLAFPVEATFWISGPDIPNEDLDQLSDALFECGRLVQHGGPLYTENEYLSRDLELAVVDLVKLPDFPAPSEAVQVIVSGMSSAEPDGCVLAVAQELGIKGYTVSIDHEASVAY